MTDPLKIPGFKVSIIDAANPANPVVKEQDFLKQVGDDFMDHQFGPNQWDNIRVRRKTVEGGMLVTFRNVSARMAEQKVDVNPDKPADLRTPGGQMFRVVVSKLPEEMWMAGQAIKFPPPRATITAEAGGWRVTFEPQQRPCILTVAVDAKGLKDEGLPSFPFPSNPAHARGSFLIPFGQFGAVEGGTVRLGVRGAGLQCRVALPKAGESVQIEPEHFKVEGPADLKWFQEAVVAGKYNEKHALIQYS
jgi:hypothetical protein